MTRQQRNEIIQKLEVLAKEQTETHNRQMTRIKNLIKVLMTRQQSLEAYKIINLLKLKKSEIAFQTLEELSSKDDIK